jgi:transcription elongation factor S-II
MYAISNPTNFRENIRKKFVPILGEDTTLSLNLEIGVFNYAVKEAGIRKIVKKWDNPHFVQIYVDRLRTVYVNLKHPDLLESVKSKEIASQNIAFMTHQEFQPDHWKDLIDRKIKRDASKYTDNIQASTDMFSCKKCRSKRCTYYEMQTRSADEPATIFITCLDCGKHWRS